MQIDKSDKSGGVGSVWGSILLVFLLSVSLMEGCLLYLNHSPGDFEEGQAVPEEVRFQLWVREIGGMLMPDNLDVLEMVPLSLVC